MAQNKLHNKDFQISIKHGDDAGATKFKKEAVVGELFFDTNENKLYIATSTAGSSDATVKILATGTDP